MAKKTTTNLDEWLPTAWAIEALERMGYTDQEVQFINELRCEKNALARGE